ncbi:MAG: hypothetical protein QM800_06880 [Paludibacter sp.]
MFEFPKDEHDRPTARSRQTSAGQVRFDERGNAIYEWRDAKLELDGQQAKRRRERALLNPTLSLVDDSPPANAPAMRNDQGLRVGYNPYESGQLARKAASKKRDMRELSKWIEMKRLLETQNSNK